MEWKNFVSDEIIELVEQIAKDDTKLEPYIPYHFPLQENFISRHTEQKMLTNWFNHTPPIFSLISHGGIGKSSLAWYWLNEDILKQDQAPTGIIWWSFSGKDSNFDNFLTQAINYTSRGKIQAKSFDSVRVRMECLYGLLANQNILLILDDVERMLCAYDSLYAPYQGDFVTKDRKGDYRSCPDSNFGDFLIKLADKETKSKTLLISRLFPLELDREKGCNRYYLRQFSLEETVEYFLSEGFDCGRTDIKTIAAPLSYRPISLHLLVGLIKEDPEYAGNIECAKEIKIIKAGSNTDLREAEKFEGLISHIFDRLSKNELNLLTQMAVSRILLDYQTIKIFDVKGDQFQLLEQLERRGLVYKIPRSEYYDLHYLVRKYAYERLKSKAKTHALLRNYYADLQVPNKRETITDFNPLIELFHHSINCGKHDEAAKLFNDKLAPLYFVFSAYQICIRLLSSFFPGGECKPAIINEEFAQGWARDALALNYSSCGQPAHSIPLMEQASKIYENMGNKKRTAIILGNLAQDQIAMGMLDAAGDNIEHCIELCRQINEELMESVAHQDLGQLYAFQGKFNEAFKEIDLSSQYCNANNDFEGLCLDEAHRSLILKFQEDYHQALDAARRARKLADVAGRNERNIIRAELLLGVAYRGLNKLSEAETHLRNALLYSHQINYIELEADILLEIARVQRLHSIALAPPRPDKSERDLPEYALRNKALLEVQKMAREALGIANRCKYRLQEADIHLFLAQLALDYGDKYKAYREAEVAYKCASCGYTPTLEAAKKFVDAL